MKHFLNRFLAVLFFLSTNTSSFALDLTYSNEVYFSKGMPVPSYWAAHPLIANRSEKVWGMADKMYKAQQAIDDSPFEYFIERRKQSVLTSNQTSLTLAALDRIPANLALGNYPLTAIVENYQMDAMGFNYHGQLLPYGLSFTVSPKVVNLYHFNEGRGNGELYVGSNAGLLIGGLDRYALNSFGFDLHPRPLNIHPGFSIDIGMDKHTDQHHFHFRVLNAFSHISVQNHYYSNRLYRVNTLNNELVFSDTPSLTGFYGQTTRTLQLPRIFQFQVQENSQVSGFSPMLGAQAYNAMVSPWLGVKYQSNLANLKIKTSDGANFHLNSEFKNVFLKDLTVVFSMYVGQYKKSDFLISNINYKF